MKNHFANNNQHACFCLTPKTTHKSNIIDYFPFSASGQRKKLETALLGKRAQFQCSVQSPDASEVMIWWQFEGKNLTTTTSEDRGHHSITVSRSASGSVSSELTLATVEWEDEGIYSCLAMEVGSTDEPTMQQIILEIYGMLRTLF